MVNVNALVSIWVGHCLKNRVTGTNSKWICFISVGFDLYEREREPIWIVMKDHVNEYVWKIGVWKHGMKRIGNKQMKGKRNVIQEENSGDHKGWLFSSFSASLLWLQLRFIGFVKTDKSDHVERLQGDQSQMHLTVKLSPLNYCDGNGIKHFSM